MNARLKIIHGTSPGACVPLLKSPFVIGQAPVCQLRPRDLAVDEQHCEIQINGARLVLRDLDSSTGTRLNGLRMIPECRARIRHGDRFQVGDTVFEVVVEVPLDTDPVTPEPLEETSTQALRLLQRRLGSRKRFVRPWSRFLRRDEVEGIPCFVILMPHLAGRTALVLWREMLGALAELTDHERIILDLRAVGTFAPEAAEVLWAFRDRLDRNGVVLKLCEVAPSVRETLEAADLGSRLSIHLDSTMAVWSSW